MSDKLLEALKGKKLLFGAKVTQHSLLASDIQEIFLSLNGPEQMKSEIKSRAQVAGIPVTELAQTSEEIGAVCKKPFAITVAAVKKTKE